MIETDHNKTNLKSSSKRTNITERVRMNKVNNAPNDSNDSNRGYPKSLSRLNASDGGWKGVFELPVVTKTGSSSEGGGRLEDFGKRALI